MSSEPQANIFGRYQLLEPIAKGGMAEVFKAKLSAAAGTEKLLCIKRILPQLSRNSEFMTLFISEARIALPLSHGNITQVFDFGEVEGVYYLAMEYIRGQNLHQVLQRLRQRGVVLSQAAALYIAAEVSKGLQYAHGYTDANGRRQVVVHRDVSPHNVLVSYTGQVKLTDFGIALAATKVRADDGVVRGKPCYVAPEQADGRATDPRTDIFALGVVLYETITGVRCFEGESETDTLRRVRAAKVTPPSQLNEELDPALDAIVLKALQRDPAQRYQRAGDLQVALTQLLHKHAPDFTAETLAETISVLFSDEIQQLDGNEGGARDRLLLQLAQAGIDLEDTPYRNATTAELLDLGTVAIGQRAFERGVDQPRRWAPWVGGAAVVALLGLALTLLAMFRADNHGSGEVDGQVAVEEHAPTDHLSPPSLKEREAEQEAAARPSQRPAAGKKGPVRRAPAPRRVGWLNCNSWPWSVVYVDGRRLQGNTPIYRVPVNAGQHRVKFVNPELGLSKEVVVVVEANKTQTVAVSLQ